MELFALGTIIIASGILISKGFDSRIIDKNATFMKIVNEGLYHFTSLENAKKILDSGYIKPSSPFVSYGTKEKCYFFAGMPDYETYAQNVNKNISDSIINGHICPISLLRITENIAILYYIILY